MKETQVADRISRLLLIVVMIIIMTGCQLTPSGTNMVSYESVELEISLKYPSPGIMEKTSPLNLQLSFENVGQIEILSRDFSILSPFAPNKYLDDKDANLVLEVWAKIYSPSGTMVISDGPTPLKINDYEISIMEMHTLEGGVAIIATVLPDDERVLLFIAVPEDAEANKQELRQILEDVLTTVQIYDPQ